MRQLLINRITSLMMDYPDISLEMDITPDQLQSYSNEELLDIFEDIFTGGEYD